VVAVSVRSGLIGLSFVCLFFAVANPRFLSSENLSALAGQIAPLILVAAAVVVILVGGEIDLSVGEVAGMGATVAGVLAFRESWPSPLAVAAGVAVGAGIGAFQGAIVTRLRVPSFVVTLAGLLIWQGTALAVLGPQGTVDIPPDSWMARLAGARLGTGPALVLVGFFVALAALDQAQARRRLCRAELAPEPWAPAAARLGFVAAALVGAVMAVGRGRGVPASLVLAGGVVTALHLVLSRTRFGRHLVAAGGDAVAARRAGVPVAQVRLAAFVLASSLAAAGGILFASRVLSVNQNTGSGDLLLTALAAAVIGGASLFGGRGTAASAVVGVLVLGTLANGMDLLNLPSAARFTLNGTVLLGAATLDAISRRLAQTGSGL
jgi:D-xylose transport system permease protein